MPARAVTNSGTGANGANGANGQVVNNGGMIGVTNGQPGGAGGFENISSLANDGDDSATGLAEMAVPAVTELSWRPR